MADPTIIKKYSNRRLYDTSESRYITLDELARRIRGGIDVQVIDAQTGADLTHATLTQLLLEERDMAGKLPTWLLVKLIRMDDDELAEFLEQYLGNALSMYVRARRSADVAQTRRLPESLAESLAEPPAAPGDPSTGSVIHRWASSLSGASRAAQPSTSWPAGRDRGSRADSSTGSPSGEQDSLSLPGLASELDEVRRELDEIKRLILGSLISNDAKKRAKPRRPRSPRSKKPGA